MLLVDFRILSEATLDLGKLDAPTWRRVRQAENTLLGDDGFILPDAQQQPTALVRTCSPV